MWSLDQLSYAVVHLLAMFTLWSQDGGRLRMDITKAYACNSLDPTVQNLVLAFTLVFPCHLPTHTLPFCMTELYDPAE